MTLVAEQAPVRVDIRNTALPLPADEYRCALDAARRVGPSAVMAVERRQRAAHQRVAARTAPPS
jgi:hypothetical protein